MEIGFVLIAVESIFFVKIFNVSDDYFITVRWFVFAYRTRILIFSNEISINFQRIFSIFIYHTDILSFATANMQCENYHAENRLLRKAQTPVL